MIGIFDSGYGGLTVMKEYLKHYPDYDYVYLGDQANVPYGNRSKDLVNKLVVRNIKFLVDKGCKLIIVACNTASADALQEVQKIYKGNPVILGVLIPAAEEALKSTKFGNIGVIGTRGTINSKTYERELNKYKHLYKPKEKRALKEVKITSKSCPLLVSFVEEGILNKPPVRMMLKNYLRPLKHANIDTLILGCTHYPLLQKEIQRLMGKRVKIISSANAAINAIGYYFEKHPKLEKSISKRGKQTYFTTDCPEQFAELGSRFLGQKIEVEKVEI